MGRSRNGATPDERAADAKPVEWPRNVLTTFGETVEVDEAEFIDLNRQGLIEKGVLTDSIVEEDAEDEKEIDNTERGAK